MSNTKSTYLDSIKDPDLKAQMQAMMLAGTRQVHVSLKKPEVQRALRLQQASVDARRGGKS